MIVYGGYRFPEEGGYFEEAQESGRDRGVERVEDDLLRYWFDTGVWEVLNTTAAVTVEERGGEEEGSGEGNDTLAETPQLPAARYGHSAVIYDVCANVSPPWFFRGSVANLPLFPSGLYVCVWRCSVPLGNHHFGTVETEPDLSRVDPSLQ